MYKIKILNRFILIVLTAGLFAPLSAQSGKKFNEMKITEIDSLIRETAQKPMTVTQKMNLFSAYFLGMPYNAKCVGDGPYALYEPWPLVNFKETNCMAYCEHVLALSISDNWDNFFNNLQQIRYKDGIIGMKTRNHYTMADWLPQNRWLLKDVSEQVGGGFTKKVSRTISHSQFFMAKGISDTSYVIPDRTLTINYIPLTDFERVLDNLKTGDILALLFAKLDDIFAAHMVIVAENAGAEKMIRESSDSKMSTFETPVDNWINQKVKSQSQRYLGVAVMRIRTNINIPGEVIYPSDIIALKQIK